jgi:hypothetical protein
MRAREFIVEKKSGRIGRRYHQASTGINVFSDGEKWNSDYTLYRLGLALACSDGSTTPIDMAAKSWIGKYKSANPYTQAEQDMLKQSYKAVGASHIDLNNGDLKSQELDSTNSVSPVAQNPWNKKKRKKK